MGYLLNVTHVGCEAGTYGVALCDETCPMMVCSQLTACMCCCWFLCQLCRQTLMMEPSTCLHFTGASAPWQLLDLVGTCGLSQGVQLGQHTVLAGNSLTTCLSTLLSSRPCAFTSAHTSLGTFMVLYRLSQHKHGHRALFESAMMPRILRSCLQSQVT